MEVSTPLPSGKVCDHRVRQRRFPIDLPCFNTFTFWEGLRPMLSLLIGITLGRFNTFTFWEGLRRATRRSIADKIIKFQHLYLLGRSATAMVECQFGEHCQVSTPLPSGKVCDRHNVLSASGGNSSFNTFTFWEGLRHPQRMLGRWDNRLHLVSTPLPSGKVCDFFATRRHIADKIIKFQHLYLLGRSATSIDWEQVDDPICSFQHLYLLGRSATSG